MCFTVTSFYLRNKTSFLDISWSWFPNIVILGTPKIIIMNICDVNSFLKILQFLPDPEKWMVETWFFRVTERARGCAWNIQKFAYTYRGTWFAILWWYFSWFCYFGNSWCWKMYKSQAYLPYIYYVKILIFIPQASSRNLSSVVCSGNKQVQNSSYERGWGACTNAWHIRGDKTLLKINIFIIR